MEVLVFWFEQSLGIARSAVTIFMLQVIIVFLDELMRRFEQIEALERPSLS